MNRSSISVLIVNWRSKDLLRKCLVSIGSMCADLAPQVVVVDAGSFDGCGEMLASEFPGVQFIQSQMNLGFGCSNNIGFEHIAGDLLLLLNPDTEVKPHSVHRLLIELERCKRAGVVGPKLLNSDDSLQISCVQALPTPLNQALDSILLRRLFPNSHLWGVGKAFCSSSSVEVEAVSGACMLLRTETFRQLGGFREEFFMYGEDMDLCARIRKLGLKVYHVPEAEVVHHGGSSSRSQGSEFSTVMMRMAMETYMRVNHGRAKACWYRALQAFSAVVRLSLLLAAWLFLGASRRTAAQVALRKWFFVLRWTIGATRFTSRLTGERKAKSHLGYPSNQSQMIHGPR